MVVNMQDQPIRANRHEDCFTREALVALAS